MPSAIRPNKKAMKIAFKILKTPKNKQQNPEQKPSKNRKREWYIDSSAAN